MSLEIARPHTTDAPIVVGTARYVLLPLANLLTGYSVKAMERKIERGDWQEGKVWKRAPDGRILIDVHADWGEAIGNYDEFRFFTGLRPSEQIALLVTDYDARRGVLSVTKARVLRRDKDRTKTQEDRDVELCPRALEVLSRHLALRREYVSAGKIHHGHLFFLEDGRSISDPEITRWRWSESIKALNIRRRGPYHARHSSVTWQLMLGKNLLWVAKQHGHSVEVMLRMYAAWLDSATDTDIYAIKQATERRPATRAAFLDSRAAISAVNTATNRARLIVIRPPESPEFGSRLAVGNSLSDSSLRNDSKIKWRRGWDSNPRAGITRPSDFESAPL
jgi:integrase